MFLVGFVLVFVFFGVCVGDSVLCLLCIVFMLQYGLLMMYVMIGGKLVMLVLDVGSYQVVGLKIVVFGWVLVCFIGDQEFFVDVDGYVFILCIFYVQFLEVGGLFVLQFDGNELVGSSGKVGLLQDGLIGFGLFGCYQMVFDELGGELWLYLFLVFSVFKCECGSEGGVLCLECGVMVFEVQIGYGVFWVQWDLGSVQDVLCFFVVFGWIKDVDLLCCFIF